MTGRTLPWRVAWVTGASSGIGRELALRLGEGGVKVAASARRADALAALTAACPAVTAYPLDVTDPVAAAATVREIEAALGPIDLALLNAGIGQRMGISDLDPEVARATMATNYLGLVNGIAAVLPGMRERRRGHLALVSSIAGYRGLPRAAAYCPSKAAAIALAESLKPELDEAGLAVSIVNPGFVDTPMTANARHPLPYLMSAEDAARRIVAGLERRRFEIAFPWQMVLAGKLGRILPYSLYFWLIARGRRT